MGTVLLNSQGDIIIELQQGCRRDNRGDESSAIPISSISGSTGSARTLMHAAHSLTTRGGPARSYRSLYRVEIS